MLPNMTKWNGGQFLIKTIRILSGIVFALLLFAAAESAEAASAPAVITYQGKLLQNNTSVTTTQTMGFFIYDAATGGNLLYTANGTLAVTSTISVTPSQGIFSVDLGGSGTNELATSTFANNRTIYLEVWIGGQRLTPRKQLTAAPYAINSEYLMGITATTSSSSLYVPISDSNGNFRFTGSPQNNEVHGGVIYINPASAAANRALFGLAVNGAERLRVDAEGDAFLLGALTVSSTLQVHAATTVSSTLTVINTSTLRGDLLVGALAPSMTTSSFVMTGNDAYVSDLLGVGNNLYVENNLYVGTSTLRLNGNAGGGLISMFGGGSLSIDAQGNTLRLNTLSNQNIYTGSGNFGVNSSTPAFGLSVNGTAYVSGATRLGQLTVSDSITLGGELRSVWPLASQWSSSTALIWPTVASSTRIVIGKSYVTSTTNIFEVQGNSAFEGNLGISSSTPAFGLSVSGTAYVSGATRLSQLTVSEHMTLGGELRTTWPLTSQWSSSTALIWPTIASSTRVVLGKSYSSSTANIFEVQGNAAIEGKLGVNTSTPNSALTVSGTTYISGTSTFANVVNVEGRIRTPVPMGTLTHATRLDGVGPMYMSGNYLYATAFLGDTLAIMDITNPSNPKMTGFITHGGNALLDGAASVAVQGNYAYVTAYLSNALTVIDVSNPANPRHVSSFADGGASAPFFTNATQVVIEGNYAYVTAAGDSCLEIVDISDPYNLRHSGSVCNGGGVTLNGPYSVAVNGRYAYVVSVTGNTLTIFDISNPAAPAQVSTLADGGVATAPHLTNPQGIFVSGNYAYIAANDDNAIEIVDISNPASPAHAGAVVNATGIPLGGPRSLIPSGDYLYVTAEDSDALTILNIASSTNPYYVSSVIDDSSGGIAPMLDGALGLFVTGNYAYTSGFNDDSFAVFDVSGANISNTNIGSAKVGILQVSNQAFFDTGIFVRSGLTVGGSGLLVTGDVGITSPTSTLTSTNTIRFSHPVLFKTGASSTQSFIFDTNSTLVSSSVNYLLSVRNNGSSRFSVSTNGDAVVSGQLFASGATVGTGRSPGDVAERVDITPNEFVEAGDVMIVDADNRDMYTRSTGATGQPIAGIISTNPTIIVGNGVTDHTAVLAMVGRVPVKVSNENGNIRAGDILVPSSVPGVAMRWDPASTNQTVLSVVGLALDSFSDAAPGKIMALLRPGWVGNGSTSVSAMQQQMIGAATSDGSLAQPTASGALTVSRSSDGRLAYTAEADINLNGFALLNVGKIAGAQNKWTIDEHGQLVSTVATAHGDKTLYAMQTDASKLVLSGSSQLENGEKHILFDDNTRDLIDDTVPMQVHVTLTSASQPIYVTQKDIDGFVVKEVGGGSGTATFDWVVVVKRKNDVIAAVPEVPRLPDVPATSETSTPIVTPTSTPEASSTSTPESPAVETVVSQPSEPAVETAPLPTTAPAATEETLDSPTPVETAPSVSAPQETPESTP